MSTTKPCEAELIVHIARGESYSSAAELCGMSRSTILRRMKDSEFLDAVSDARLAIIGEATGKLASSLDSAVGTLVGLLDSKCDATRLRAATALCEYSLRFRKAIDLEARLRRLEERLGERVTLVSEHSRRIPEDSEDAA